VQLRFFIDFVDPRSQMQFSVQDVGNDVVVTGHVARFGSHPEELMPAGSTARFGRGEGVELVRDKSNIYGCLPYLQSFQGEAIFLHRGQCTFLEKLQRASEAGASGVIVISNEDIAISPTAGEEEIQEAGHSLDEVALIVLKKSEGREVTVMMDVTDGGRVGRVMVVLERSAASSSEREVHDKTKQHGPPEKISRMLYVNGHPLINTRLLG